MKSLQHYFSLLFSFLLLFSTSSMFAQRTNQYQVVINHEEQYSIWPAFKKAPKGWESTKIEGTRSICQKYIEEVWTDMRPLSIQNMNLPKDTEYNVVINHEEQYSIWPKNRNLPKGWKATKIVGNQIKCQKYIDQVWTDMRPLSIQIRSKKRNLERE